MYLIEEDPKSRQAVLRNIAASAIEQYAATPTRVDVSVQKAKARGTSKPVLLLRTAIIQYLGAAYFLRDRDHFRAAANAFTSHSDTFVSALAPEPALLEVDLCLALLGGPAKTRRALVRAAWEGAGKIDRTDSRGRIVVILSSLADLNREAAEAEMEHLGRLCEQQAFDLQETRYLQTWLQAAGLVASGASQGIARMLGVLDRECATKMEKEADRLLRGGSSPITAASFVDLPTAALAALAAAMLPPADRPSSVEGGVADYRWIAEAAWG
jgi:hypothetical protein